MEIDTSMNIEKILFNDYKQYLTANSVYSPEVLPKSKQSSPKTPSVFFRERNNTNDMENTTIDRSQRVYQLSYVVEIYTQNKTVNGTLVASKVIMDELKYLTFDFFEYYGLERTSCEEVETYNKELDRLVIIYDCKVNSWNRKIS